LVSASLRWNSTVSRLVGDGAARPPFAQLFGGEDGVLDEEAVHEECLTPVGVVDEREADYAHRRQPPGVGEHALLRLAVVDDDEEVDVGVFVEPGVLDTCGSEPEDGDHVRVSGKRSREIIQTAKRRVHHRPLT
jgi:hypothetical protein